MSGRLGVILVATVFGLGVLPARAWSFPRNRAGTYTVGNQLWDYCGSTTDGPPRDLCVADIEGVVDGMLWAAGFNGSGVTQARFCIPDGVTNFQVVDVVRRFLFTHPELRNDAESALIEDALRGAFPCDEPTSR
ncbi:MAG TPA: Rap1a/Tai family immunity protein [Caulobacteraceae bacterium]|nr:Rap1a/Tai family immunity protein [Caulobacteraceae bacterium]